MGRVAGMVARSWSRFMVFSGRGSGVGSRESEGRTKASTVPLVEAQVIVDRGRRVVRSQRRGRRLRFQCMLAGSSEARISDPAYGRARRASACDLRLIRLRTR